MRSYLCAAIMLGSSLAVPSSAIAQIAGFWGRPFPYGYTYGAPYDFSGGRSCVHYVRVETSHGLQRRRIWTCR